MGEIFLARLEGAAGFEKLYVIKRILPHLADDARFRQMLIAEARIASKLSHANICQVYELGETSGQLYIVMEYLDGITLLPMLRRASKQQQPLNLGLVGGVLQQCCDALHYAHELKDRGERLGIVHRDVTPSNVFLTESGVVKVLDFGIAKAKGASTQTQEGTVKGKYAYMAPEQLRGGEIDHRVDVFALGIVVYEMLALRRLFQRKTDYMTFRAVMEQPIADIRRYRPDAPALLAEALTRALDRDPTKRFENARQLGTAILDSLGKRAWSQGEISDYVRENFATEIGRRNQQVASVVHRTGAGGDTRATMPLLAHEDAPVDDERESHDDDDDFPAVETETQFDKPARKGTPAPVPAQPSDFVVPTPPPFGTEMSTPNALQPISMAPSPASAATQTVIVARRSLLWPLVAVGMLLVAGGALFLVWQQMQQHQPPTSVVITQTPDPRHGELPPSAVEQPMVGSAPPSAPVERSGSGSSDSGSSDSGSSGSGSSGSGSSGGSRSVRPAQPTLASVKPKGDPYTAAVQARLPTLTRCLADHQDTPMPSGATATILIATTGHPKNVALEPASLATTPLGQCLKNILLETSFPRATADKQITVPFKT
jgi:serine/threonine-protein kinase